MRIHTVGQDCSVGKMLASVELTLGLKKRGYDAKFIATGQTGIMIEGDGCPVDCVVSDFVNGAVEKLILANQHHDFLLIEGQGSLSHPRYSAVTLGLLHGCVPQGMILVYEAGRKNVHGMDYIPLTPLKKIVEMNEMMASLAMPSKVIGVAMNSRSALARGGGSRTGSGTAGAWYSRVRCDSPRTGRFDRSDFGVPPEIVSPPYSQSGLESPPAEQAVSTIASCNRYRPVAASTNMKLSYKKFDLPLRHVFTISRGSVTVQETLIVQLESGGSTVTARRRPIRFTARRSRTCRPRSSRCARSSKQYARRSAPADRRGSLKACRDEKYANFALNALDLAIHDLWGKLRGAPVYKLWGLTTDKIPDSDYTLGIDTPEKMVAKMEEMPGWPVYKIKLGTADDLTIVRELRKHTDALFRVDANCGWTAEQTIEFAPVLKELRRRVHRAAASARRREGARRAFEGSALPLIADENCIVEGDVDRCAGGFHGINIKLVKCGGLAAARRMIARARELGLQGHGRLHDGVDRRHFGDRAAVAAAGLRGHGWRRLDRQGHRDGRAPRPRQVHLPKTNGTGVELIDGPF